MVQKTGLDDVTFPNNSNKYRLLSIFFGKNNSYACNSHLLILAPLENVQNAENQVRFSPLITEVLLSTVIV